MKGLMLAAAIACAPGLALADGAVPTAAQVANAVAVKEHRASPPTLRGVKCAAVSADSSDAHCQFERAGAGGAWTTWYAFLELKSGHWVLYDLTAAAAN